MTLHAATSSYLSDPTPAFYPRVSQPSPLGRTHRQPAVARQRRMIAQPAYAARTTTSEFADLLHEAQLGDEVAFASLMRHYRRFAEVAAQRILRTEEAAADAVQEAMYKVYRALPKFQDGNFRSWLLRIVKNTCYDHLRQQTRRQTVSLEELTEFDEAESGIGVRTADERENPESMIVQQEAMQCLLAAIDDLPACHREVVLLVDIHGLDYTEAADYLDVPMGTVKSRLSRARAALRDRLTELGLVPGQVA